MESVQVVTTIVGDPCADLRQQLTVAIVIIVLLLIVTATLVIAAIALW